MSSLPILRSAMILPSRLFLSFENFPPGLQRKEALLLQVRKPCGGKVSQLAFQARNDMSALAAIIILVYFLTNSQVVIAE